MNILISSNTALDPALVEQLVQMPDSSIYLSLSQEDTFRILNEAKPAILITDGYLTPFYMLTKLINDNTGMEVFIYEKNNSESGDYSLTKLSAEAGIHQREEFLK